MRPSSCVAEALVPAYVEGEHIDLHVRAQRLMANLTTRLRDRRLNAFNSPDFDWYIAVKSVVVDEVADLSREGEKVARSSIFRHSCSQHSSDRAGCCFTLIVRNLACSFTFEMLFLLLVRLRNPSQFSIDLALEESLPQLLTSTSTSISLLGLKITIAAPCPPRCD